jgi:hypothetical protein
MTRKTIFEWAELFQEDVSNGASQSDIVQMLEDYKKEQLTMPVVVKSLPQDNYCNVCNLPTDGEKCYSKRCPV